MCTASEGTSDLGHWPPVVIILQAAPVMGVVSFHQTWLDLIEVTFGGLANLPRPQAPHS